MNPHLITPVVLTYNEQPNLERCLSRLSWASRVIVVDSGSTDETKAIAKRFANVEWLERTFDNHTNQWNWAVDQACASHVLSLDADYMVPESFPEEVRTLQQDLAAYYCSFRYCVYGHPLRASLYPPRAVLFETNRCRYVQDGHTQRLHINGPHGQLTSVIDHDDRKPLNRWLASQENYAQLEVQKLLHAEPSSLRLQDKLRLAVWPAAPISFLYTLFVKGVILDGFPGMFYAFQRTVAELILSMKLAKIRMNSQD